MREQKTNIYHAIILAGGLGTRLWPRSRQSRPKQFQCIESGTMTLLQQTALRLAPIFSWDRIWVIIKPDHKKELIRQLPELNQDRILIEPAPKGTAAAISWATAKIEALFPDPILGVFPADHLIGSDDEFKSYVLSALEWANNNHGIALLGIKPLRPETAYGYIESEETLGHIRGNEYKRVRSFHEKPNEAMAREYILSGRAFWNSGIFFFRAETLFDALKSVTPEIWRHYYDTRRARHLPYNLMPDESIDRLLIERLAPPSRTGENNTEDDGAPHSGCDKITLVVFPANLDWHDIGIWESFYSILPKDVSENAESGLTVTLDCSGCLIVSGKDIMTAAIGVNGLAIIAEGDSVLVCPRDRLNEVKILVEKIKIKGLNKYL
ncbi:MAG: mannose-1-phosphate guanylyltransferase [Dissulfurimicrobium sp.]|uniref:mannose-1-phosphate guanylyltransferase n=1 Tax=Dissulfurimicrobium sp. TaxID=2022436 RepID=UPI004049DA5E